MWSNTSWFYRLTSFVIMVSVLFCVLFSSSAASAAEINQECFPDVIVAYTDIHMISASFDIQNGTASCFGSGKSQHGDSTTTLTVTLQKSYLESSSWNRVASWSSTGHGTELVYVSSEKVVSSGYRYRIYVNCTVKDSNGNLLESAGIYSRIVEYA